MREDRRREPANVRRTAGDARCRRGVRAARPLRLHGVPRRGAGGDDRRDRPPGGAGIGRFLLRRAPTRVAAGAPAVDPRHPRANRRRSRRSSTTSTWSSPCTASAAGRCSPRSCSEVATAGSPPTSPATCERHCPTTRSSTTWNASRSSCRARTPATRSTCRPTPACSSNCHREPAAADRCGTTGRSGLVPPTRTLIATLADGGVDLGRTGSIGRRSSIVDRRLIGAYRRGRAFGSDTDRGAGHPRADRARAAVDRITTAGAARSRPDPSRRPAATVRSRARRGGRRGARPGSCSAERCPSDGRGDASKR